MKQVILTGIRANDELTLGNYLGAVLPMAELQKQHAGEYQINMFVPDLHSFTTPIDHQNLYANTIRNLKYFVAAGLDIDQPDTFVYRQSFIPAHSELTWILDCFAGFGEISGMIEFKDKAKRQGANVSVGLFNYPVLMAADILLYGAKYVPVGEDQTQHLEITRDIGGRMNAKFGDDLFQLPAPVDQQLKFIGMKRRVRIRSLSNPEQKMSKSIADPRGTILLSDDPKTAAKKIMSATTDSIASVNFDFQKQPGIANLLQILALLSEKDVEEVASEWKGQTNYGDLKKVVAAKVEESLTAFQARVAAVDEAHLLSKLRANEAKMAEVANQTLHRVQVAVGLRAKGE